MNHELSKEEQQAAYPERRSANALSVDVAFRDLGKIKKAIIQLRPFTVIAGCNSSGKSFITKSLYSIFSSVPNPDTKQIVFVFTDDMGHIANDYFATKEASYLTDNKTQFVADISAAPSLIRSMFIMPGLKDYNHTTLLITEKDIAAAYRSSVDFEKIVVVSVEDMKISAIKTITTLDELIKIVEK